MYLRVHGDAVTDQRVKLEEGASMAVAAPSSSSFSAAVADEAAACPAPAGAAFVLESRGTWWHAGFHLTTAMVGPAVLSLPYALRGIGWALGLATLTALAAVSFYTYYVMSRVLDHCEAAGRRHIRFRDLAADVLGSGWAFYLMVAVQGAINVGVTIGSILLAGNSLQAFFTFYPLAITGYWAFGKTVRSNAIQSLMPDAGPSLAPRWLLCLAVVLVLFQLLAIAVLFQLLAIALLYAQVVYEVMEKRVADAARGRFSWRNLLPRVAMRTLYVAAALTFFGEIVGVIGAVGYIPLDFILPVVMYNMVVSPPRRSVVYVPNVAIMVLFTGVGVIGAVASVRKLVLNAGRFKLFNDHVVK